MPASDPGLRRVSVHAGTALVDLALPANVPLAILVSSIIDILKGRGVDGSGALEARRYQLSRLGAAALDTSTTLAQNGIRDGAVLVLSQSPTPLPAARCDDVAEAVSATLDAAARPRTHYQHLRATCLTGALVASCLTGIGALALVRNALNHNSVRDPGTAAGVAAVAGLVALLFAAIAHRAYQEPITGIALSGIATAFAAVAGFLVVPGTPGIPNVLLGATAAAVTSVLALRVSGCGVVTLTAVSCVATVIAIAALVGVITAAPLRAIGSVSALISLGVLGVAARVAILLAGLSPRLPPTPDLETLETEAARLAAKTIRADNRLASLRAAFSASAAVGAIITVLAGAPRLCCIAFGTLTGALLLLRARSVDGRPTPVFVISGIVITGTTFGVVALRACDELIWSVSGVSRFGV
ncbi:MAG TPA: type VII secretion integral membrane protein EccD, partial [Mycobacterium sp.]|nr:type VII secretion integral membrane protein EccD [Mycobacterium sp.]